MYVCLCKGITDSQIRDAVCSGASSLRQVRSQLGVMSQCGKCGVLTKEIMEETMEQRNFDHGEPLFYAAS
ncbi:MAG: bacterioferritin-associated ferredoxin [Cellvibrionaceae bacterium]|nr:bacterioferritin-associated ferredoxin [Cellvibrionaceae bacterium]MCV6626074.1 bacterioferritin-associated ferredoxin [Cellvibrionaceae bacterium]